MFDEGGGPLILDSEFEYFRFKFDTAFDGIMEIREDFMKEFENCAKTCSSLGAEFELLNKKSEASIELSRQMAKEIVQHKDKINSLEKMFEERADEYVKVGKENKQLKQEVKELNEKVKELNGKNTELNEKVERLERTVAQMNARFDARFSD